MIPELIINPARAGSQPLLISSKKDQWIDVPRHHLTLKRARLSHCAPATYASGQPRFMGRICAKSTPLRSAAEKHADLSLKRNWNKEQFLLQWNWMNFFNNADDLKCTPKHQKQIFLRVRPVVLQVADPQILQFLRCSHTGLRATGTWRYTWSSDVLGLTWLICVFPRKLWRNYGQSVLKFSKIRFYHALSSSNILYTILFPWWHPLCICLVKTCCR
jgi:hypothetical protein